MIPKKDALEGEPILDSVWAMKSARDIKNRRLYKYKAQLNVRGVQKNHGNSYTNIYSSLVSWLSILLLLILLVVNLWHTRQVEFVIAHPWAPIKHDLYIKISKGIETNKGNIKTHVLKLIKNLYRQK